MDYAVSATPVVVLVALHKNDKHDQGTKQGRSIAFIRGLRFFGYAFKRLSRNNRWSKIFRRILPLFGYDLNDYDNLFSLNIELFITKT